MATNITPLQQEIGRAVGQMQQNLTKVSERGERLDSLQDKTDNLATSAQGFRRGANRVRKQMWWKDMKMRICIIVGIIILLIVIIVPSGELMVSGVRYWYSNQQLISGGSHCKQALSSYQPRESAARTNRL